MVYEIRIKGHLDCRWTEWFGGLIANLNLEGETGDGSPEGTIVHAPGGRGTWIRNPAPKAFVNPGHVREPWLNVLKGEQSIALLVPGGARGGGAPGVVQVLDFPEFVMGILYSVLETEPEGDQEIQFALALNQTEQEIKHLIAALGK